MLTFPLTYMMALSVGFAHAFEADHLVAVGNLVSRKKSWRHAAMDGMWWGLGHSSAVIVIGMMVISGKQWIDQKQFGILEGLVGFMLMAIGTYRLMEIIKDWRHSRDGHKHNKMAYGVGLIHGLAGSGGLILFAISKTNTMASGMLFLLLFGIGSMIGMTLASGIFSMPFSINALKKQSWPMVLALLSAIVCIYVGGALIIENWF